MNHLRRGFSSLEVLVAGAMATVLGLGMLSMLFLSSRETAVSADYMFAEALSQRVLADALSLPWEDLEKIVGEKSEWQELGLEIDFRKEDQRLVKFYPSYGMSVGGSLESRLEASVRVKQVAPGLIAFEVEISWPMGPDTKHRRTHVQMRLRSRKDLAIQSNFPLEGGA